MTLRHVTPEGRATLSALGKARPRHAGKWSRADSGAAPLEGLTSEQQRLMVDEFTLLVRLAERHAALVEALAAAGFDAEAASPLQHGGPCGWWRNAPCDCPIKKLAVLLRQHREEP